MWPGHITRAYEKYEYVINIIIISEPWGTVRPGGRRKERSKGRSRDFMFHKFVTRIQVPTALMFYILFKEIGNRHTD